MRAGYISQSQDYAIVSQVGSFEKGYTLYSLCTGWTAKVMVKTMILAGNLCTMDAGLFTTHMTG